MNAIISLGDPYARLFFSMHLTL